MKWRDLSTSLTKNNNRSWSWRQTVTEYSDHPFHHCKCSIENQHKLFLKTIYPSLPHFDVALFRRVSYLNWNVVNTFIRPILSSESCTFTLPLLFLADCDFHHHVHFPMPSSAYKHTLLLGSHARRSWEILEVKLISIFSDSYRSHQRSRPEENFSN